MKILKGKKKEKSKKKKREKKKLFFQILKIRCGILL